MFRRVGIATALLIGDLAIVVLAIVLASWMRPHLAFGRAILPEDTWPSGFVYVFALVVWGITFSLTDVYNLRKNLRTVDELQHLLVAHAVATLAFAGVLYFSFRETSRLQVLLFSLIGFLLLLIYRLTFRVLLQHYGHRRYGTRRVLLAGSNAAGQEAAHTIMASSWTGLQLVGYVDNSPQNETAMGCNYLGPLTNTIDIVQEQHINEVIFALPRTAHAELANLVVDLHRLKVNVRVVPDFFDLVFLKSVVEDLGDMPLVTLKEPALNPLQRFQKRVFDLLFGTVGLIISLPIMAIIAIAIKLDSPGPIFYTQTRVGENGRLFKMIKLRTMKHDPDSQRPDYAQKLVDGQPIYKFYEDPRVTRLGRFLRSTSLDELPQFVNVLKGDMSLVGPRPELPWLVEKYQPWQRKRFEVPQGLTGWWQINGRADKPMHLNTQDDLYYVRNYSLLLDLQIMARTIIAIISRRGSY